MSFMLKSTITSKEHRYVLNTLYNKNNINKKSLVLKISDCQRQLLPDKWLDSWLCALFWAYCVYLTLYQGKKISSRPHNLTSGSLWAVTPINNPSFQSVSDHLYWKYFPWKDIRGLCFLPNTAWCHRLNIVCSQFYRSIAWHQALEMRSHFVVASFCCG